MTEKVSMTFLRHDMPVKNGTPFYATLPNDLETCCDCALTHRIRYRIEDANGDLIKGARLRITVWRDEEGTKKRRALPAGMIGKPGFLVDVETVKKTRQRKK